VVARDHERLLGVLDRLDRCPLGAAALAGSSHPLDREASARALGFAAPVANTYDAVASSDWQVDVAGVGQTSAIGLSRLVPTLVLGGRRGGWLRLADDLVQGSSIMPQKRNPVVLEHARTRSRARGRRGPAGRLLSHNVPFTDVNDAGTDAQEALHQVLGADGRRRAAAGVPARREPGTATSSPPGRGHRHHRHRARRRARADGGPALPGGPPPRRVPGPRMADLGRPSARPRPPTSSPSGGPRLGTQALAEALAPAAFVARRGGSGDPPRPPSSSIWRRCGRAWPSIIERSTPRPLGSTGRSAPAHAQKGRSTP
jgi:argininosuccinate lyase